jgi:hypothetical protein
MRRPNTSPLTRGALALCALAVLGGDALAQGVTPPAPPRPNMKVIRKLRVRFEREPTVRDVQQAALKFFKVHPDRVAGYRAGAAWKALVPDVEVTFNTERGTNDRRLTDAIYQIRFPIKESENTQRSGYTIGVRAHWAFDRLIFNAEVLDVTSLVGVQEGLLREITSLYFTRRRLMTIMALNPPKDPGEQITESIRLDEISANLDALTGGYLTRELKKRFRGRAK